MTISLRNLPHELELAILEKSRREGISLNKAVTQLLELAVHPAKRNTVFDEFAGQWSPEEAAEFDRAMAAIRRVEPEDWKP